MLLTKHDASHGSTRAFGTSDQPGLDASGNASTRLAHLPQYPHNTSGGRVVLSATTVLPAGMGIRHPASFGGDQFAGHVCEYLALWRNCADPAAKQVCRGSHKNKKKHVNQS